VNSATDLRSLARHRLAALATSRADPSLGAQAVAQSHPLGNATMRHLRQAESRAVAGLSHRAATGATPASRASRTVAFLRGCDNATTSGTSVPQGEPGACASISRKRPVSWSEPADAPLIGDTCSCCRGARWWCETQEPSGWRCWSCHPPDHLRADAVREFRTPIAVSARRRGRHGGAG